MKTSELLLSVCGYGIRYQHVTSCCFRIWPKTEEEGEAVCRKLLDSGRVRAATSGWTGLKWLNMVRREFLLRIGRSQVRIQLPLRRPELPFDPFPPELLTWPQTSGEPRR